MISYVLAVSTIQELPSTNMLLSLKLLEDGVDMGIRGDRRINAEGLSSSVSDEGKA